MAQVFEAFRPARRIKAAHRRGLTDGERALVRSVFDNKIACGRVRLGLAPWTGAAVAVGSFVLFPARSAGSGAGLGTGIADFSACALPHRRWFIHEMAHVWQFQRRPLWTLASWMATLLTGGYGSRRNGYRYPPAPDWRRLNLEQQAEVIADAYAAAEGGLAPPELFACLQAAGLPAPPLRG